VIAFFHALFQLVAQAIVKLHDLTGPIFGEHSGLSWAAAIMLLTVCVRLAMYPLFLKQIKTQRTMQLLQPKIKELQKKHKGDRESLNAEMMKLYKEHNANPLAGCLPMLLQMPIFISLFQVLSQLARKEVGKDTGVFRFPVKFGLDLETVKSFESAKIFGAPIGSGFGSKAKLLEFLNANPGPVRVVSAVLIVAMAATTFVTSKQMMGKNKPTDSSQATQQKILLYVMPLMLGLFGFQVAIGVLIYWTTTNVFSMGQQALVMRRLGPVDPNAKPASRPSKPVSARGGKAAAQTVAETAKPAPKPKPEPVAEGAAPRPSANRRPNNRNTKRGKGRRGGRR